MASNGCKHTTGPGWASPQVGLHCCTSHSLLRVRKVYTWLTVLLVSGSDESTTRDSGLLAMHSPRWVSTRLFGHGRHGSLKQNLQSGTGPPFAHDSDRVTLVQLQAQEFGTQVIHRLPMLHTGDELHHSGQAIS